MGLGLAGRTTPREPAEVKAFAEALSGAGHTISANRRRAFAEFVRAAKAHGYWDKLIDVHPYEGTVVEHVAVKLKGGGALTNSGFVNGDILEGGGLQGDGTSYFSTGRNYNSFTAGLGGLSAWVKTWTPSGTQWLMGVGNGQVPQMVMECNNQVTGMSGRWGGVQIVDVTLSAAIPEGLYRVGRPALNVLDMYVGGSRARVNTTSVSTATRDAVITTFAGAGLLATTARILFSAIDDGTMMEAENAWYQVDLRMLLVALGRVTPEAGEFQALLIVGQSLAVGAQGSPPLTTTPVGSSVTKGNGSLSSNSTENPSSRFGDVIGVLRPLVGTECRDGGEFLCEGDERERGSVLVHYELRLWRDGVYVSEEGDPAVCELDRGDRRAEADRARLSLRSLSGAVRGLCAWGERRGQFDLPDGGGGVAGGL